MYSFEEPKISIPSPEVTPEADKPEMTDEEKIADKKLTIRDIPQYRDGIAYTTFDSEGALATPIELIQNGVLTNFYHNSKTANYYKVKNKYNVLN